MIAALSLLTPVILAVFAMQMERFESFSTRSGNLGKDRSNARPNPGGKASGK